MVHQCYYCDQIFETKEVLFDHLDVHATPEKEQEKTTRTKKTTIKKTEPTKKKSKSMIKTKG